MLGKAIKESELNMSEIRVYESCKGEGSHVKPLASVFFKPDEVAREMQLLQVYTDIREQTINGFGGAFTQAAAQVYESMGAEKQKEILQLLFGPEHMAYNCGRIPMGACDFSDGNYSYCDDQDPALEGFSLGRDAQTLLPFVKSAAELVGDLELMASPWSPPAWMKSNGQMCGGGELKAEYYDAWADYFVCYIQACAQQGVRISQVSVQNEPKAVQVWESCLYTAMQEQRFVRDYLAPKLEKAGLADVGIIIWDHNKERAFIRAREIISGSAMEKAVRGIAFHWYSGDHFENLALCRRFFPNQELIFTEGCVELTTDKTTMGAKAAGTEGMAATESAPWAFGEFYAHDIIGNLNGGMNRFIDWNLLLDLKGGPNHVANYCSAPLICDAASGKIYRQPSFDYISHFSRFLPRGSVRLATSRYTAELEMIAAETPEGKTVVVVMNPTDNTVEAAISDVAAERIAEYSMKPHSIVTFVWSK